jgi:acetyl esterase/lipase
VHPRRHVPWLVFSLTLIIAGCAPAPAYRTVGDGAVDLGPSRRDVAYGPHPDHVADLYLAPDTVAPQGTILYLHGGGWTAGDKAPMGTQAALLLAQVARGWDVVSANYRLAGTAPYPAAVDDVAAAIRWVRAHGARHGLDPQTVVLAGLSAGAHLAALVALSGGDRGSPEWDAEVSGAILVAGIYEMAAFGPILERTRWIPHRGDYHKASPVSWLDADDPPLFVAHGTEDPIVPLDQERTLVRRAQEVGHPRVDVHEVGDPGLAPTCRAHVVYCGIPAEALERFLDGL